MVTECNFYSNVMGFFLLLLFTLLSASPSVAQKYADIVVDEQGRVLHGNDADGKRFPASLTKMMTLYILFEALSCKKITMETTFSVSKNAPKVEPGKLGLKVGQKVSVRHIILGLITKSANDAGVVAAEGMCGNVAKFATLMNQTAKRLGMKHTVFYNPHGLPHPKQLSTARDMATLSRALIRDYPAYYKLFKTRSFLFRGIYFPNHNHLLGKVHGVDGIKTGFFRAAGSNLAASAIRTVHGKPKRIIAVVLGGQNRFVRDKRMTELLDLGFSHVGYKNMNRDLKSNGALQHTKSPAISAKAAVKNVSLPITGSISDPIADLIASKTQNKGRVHTKPVPLAANSGNSGNSGSDTISKTSYTWIKGSPASS